MVRLSYVGVCACVHTQNTHAHISWPAKPSRRHRIVRPMCAFVYWQPPRWNGPEAAARRVCTRSQRGSNCGKAAAPTFAPRSTASFLRWRWVPRAGLSPHGRPSDEVIGNALRANELCSIVIVAALSPLRFRKKRSRCSRAARVAARVRCCARDRSAFGREPISAGFPRAAGSG